MRDLSSGSHVHVTARADDARMQDAVRLLTRDAGGLLATALAGAGGRVLKWSPMAVHARPGGSTTVEYRVAVDWGGPTTSECLFASTGGGRADHVDGVVVLGDGVQEVRLWRFPADPALPGLAEAATPGGAARILGALGVPGFGPGSGPLRVIVRTYRPCRRAVLEVQGPQRAVFLRVLRPDAAQGVHERHALLAAAGVPVAHSWGCTAHGVLAVAAVPGRTLRERLGTAGPLPSAAELLAVLDALPREVTALPHRPSWADGASGYGEVLAATLPGESAWVGDLADAIVAGLAGLAGQTAQEPTHGDFHDAQLIVEGGRVTGVLDVDTLGPGRRADDLATLVGHLEAQVLAGATGATARARLAAAVRAAGRHRVDDRELCFRTAGVLLSLATGPFRNQEADWQQATRVYLQAVDRWVCAGSGRV